MLTAIAIKKLTVMKKFYTLLTVLIVAFLFVSVSQVKGQTTIVSDGLENASTQFTVSGGTYYSGNSASTDRPATSPFAVQGTYSCGKSNGTATFTSSDINTSSYTSVYLTFRLAAFSIGSTTNGLDATDIVTVEVSPNGGTNYYSTVRVLGPTANNAYWAYSTGTGTATTAYDGNTTPVDFQPAGNGSRTTDGYSTVSITGLPQVSNMRIRITLLNNATAERWVIDDFKVLGTATSTPTITVSPASLTGFAYNYGSGPSSEQTFTASGSNLTANITLTPPTDYEISTTSGSGFGSSVTLTQSGGTVSNTTIYTRLKSGLSVGNYNSENIVASSTGATSQNVTCSGTVNCIAPTLSFASSLITKNTGDASFTNTLSSNSGGTVTYSSSNTSVATINSSSGLVTIVGAGTTTITANQAASGNYCSGSTTYTLNVRSVTVSPSSLSFSSNVGVTSAAQTVTVTGTNLSTTPTYSISGADAAMFSASGTLTTSGGTISVTFTPTSVGSKSATLTVSGEGGAIIKTVSLTGTASLSTPTATSATNISTTSFTANWNTVSGASCYDLTVYTKTSGGNASDLFFSEYLEGSSNNKYLEIYNGTGASVSLNDYKIELYANGSATVTSSLTLSGTLTNGSTYVIGNSSGTIYTPNLTNATVMAYNGDDAIALVKVSTGNFVDIIGRIGEDPGTAWVSGSYSTLDKTLVRKSSVSGGITTNPSSGFPTLTTEWDYYATDVVTYLGSHTYSGGTSNTPISGSPFTGIGTNSYNVTGLTQGTTYYYTVVATDCGSTSSGTSNEISATTSTGPTINTSTSSISNLDYNVGNGPSSAQTFTVTGTDLTDNIIVSPPLNYEVSTDGTNYSGSVTISESAGSASGTLYVRLISGLSVNSYTGNITLSSTGASTVYVALSGNVIFPAPVATSANPVLSDGFTANWNAVSGAASYILSVYTKSGGSVTDLLISEYVEGSSNNKYIELYNGTGSSKDLSNYKLQLYSNGSSTASSDVTLSGTLANGSTIVYKNSLATLYSGTSTANAAVGFNGNDAVVLYKISPAGYVDIFGNIGEDPGTAWTSGSYTTVNKTLVRKSTVTAGVTSDPASGFPTLSTEWDQYDEDDVSHLGSHTSTGGSNVQISGSPFTISAPTTTYTVTGLTPGATYYYTVVAVYGSDYSANSNEITVTLPTGATITATPTVISGLDYALDKGPSNAETFTVSGAVLSTDIIITAPTHFEISLDGNTYTSSLTLAHSSGTVNSTTIYVRLKAGLSVGFYDGETISLTTTGGSATVTVSGTVRIGDILINDIVDTSNWNMFMPLSGTLKVYERSTGGGGYANELFFSKYLEGQSANKLLEIFNGTDQTISLATYKVKVFQNGGSQTIDWSNTSKVRTYTLTGSLAPGEAKVIYTKETNPSNTICSNFDSSWQECLSPLLEFNGNDPIILTKNDTIIDVIGQTAGTTPATLWGDSGTDFNTLRVFLVRNNSVVDGSNAVLNDASDFTTLTTEWSVAQNIDEGVAGTTTCDAISAFGSYDYNAHYSTWVDITTTGIGNTVNQTNRQVTLTNATSRPCEELKAEIVNSSNSVLTSNTFRVPIFVSSNNTVNGISSLLTDEVCADCDVAVLSGATLTASTSGKKFNDAFVLGGGKLDVQNNLELNDLILKAGYGGNVYDAFPTSSMRVDASGGILVNGTFAYARQIDDSQWYFISFPYDVLLTDIVGLNSTLGTYNTDWFIKYWDGQARAINRTATGSNWKKYISTDANYIANGGYLKANVGYIIGLASGTKQIYFPMKKNYTIPMDGVKTIPASYFVKGDGTYDAYSDGWNLIGVPFFTKLSGADFPSGYKILLSDGGASKTYTVKYASDITTTPINPFISYYIQAGSTGNITFNTTSRSLVPRKVSQTTDFDNVRIFYTSSTGEDYMNLELDDTQSTAYVIGRDFVKWFGTGTPKPQVYMTQGGYNLAVDAVDYTSAVNIPVTVYNLTAGNVTFKADVSYASTLETLILTDKTTGTNTNLLTSDYTYAAAAGTVSNRFILSAQRVATGTTVVSDDGIRIITSEGNLRVENIPAGSNVKLFDMLGRLIKNENSNQNIVELIGLYKGIYIVQITINKKVKNHKVVL